MAERMIRKGEVTEIDPKTGKQRKVIRSRTPREALDMKTHRSPSVEPGSGRGPGTVKHPMGGLRAQTIQDEIEAATPALKDRMQRLRRAPLPKKKPKRKQAKGGGMMKMNYSRGGKVRGVRIAKQGVRKAKMVRMKGA